VSDFERRLRDAMSAMVAGAEPPPAVMEGVRRRHRRRHARLASAGVVIAAAAVAVAPAVSALRAGAGPAGHGHPPGGLLFPGGGRLLLLAHEDLHWLYPHGRTVQHASGFAGAMPELSSRPRIGTYGKGDMKSMNLMASAPLESRADPSGGLHDLNIGDLDLHIVSS
jgi:hypothetical protein